MTDRPHEVFDRQIGPDAPIYLTDIAAEERRRLHIAACALLLELAHADDDFSEAERAHAEVVVRASFGLDDQGAQELIAAAQAERAEGAGLHEFADLIRGYYDVVQKTRLVEILWSLARSDGRIAAHEERMMARVVELLGLAPEDVARARNPG